MSTEQKEQLGNTFLWVFRVLTALGAFFLYKTYDEIAGTRRDVNRMMLDQARWEVETRKELHDHAQTLDKHEQWIRDYERKARQQ